MHDLGRFRANLDAIAERLSTRGLTLPLEEFRDLDKSRRRAITETEQLQAQQNALSREIFQLRKEGADAAELQQKSRVMGDRSPNSPKRWRRWTRSSGRCWREFPTCRTNRFRWESRLRTTS